MLAKSKIALSLALVLAAASAATAATKHPVHHPRASIARQASPNAYQAYGSASPNDTRLSHEPANVYIQDQLDKDSGGGD
jgi:hypothetical protein